ncbi:hypothetical protein L9F63_017068, partial [Diploptera punctata]
RIDCQIPQIAINNLKSPTPGRDPTTAQHGDFWLLGFPPGPVRPSLTNLATQGSPRASILMPSLVRTPSQREALSTRTPVLKSSSIPGLQVAGLQEYATTPGRQNASKFIYLCLVRMFHIIVYENIVYHTWHNLELF